MNVVALDANPVRAPFRPGRVVTVRYLTPKRMHHTLFGPMVEEALRDILGRLSMWPSEASPRAAANGEIEIRAKTATAVVLAVCEGLTFIEMVEGLAKLHARGWRP